MNKKKQKLLSFLNSKEYGPDFFVFEEAVDRMRKEMKKNITVLTLDQVNTELARLKENMNLQPLTDLMNGISKDFDTKVQELSESINRNTEELSSADTERTKELVAMISALKAELVSLEKTRKSDLESVKTKIDSFLPLEDTVNEMMLEVSSRLDTLENVEKEEMEDWQKKIDELRKDLMNRIGSIGGGNMNRQIFINGVNPLTRFTDLNLKAGSNVTISYANNNATQKVDVTISATGGGGGGTVRSINNISTSQVAGSTSGTDYVYLCTGTLTLTLPDATAGNTNLYTVKNVGTGVVTIDTTSAQTIDNDLTVIMPVRYTSVDIISDTANWNIT